MMHNRMTPQGLALGKISSRLADMGLSRLLSLGLGGVKAPKLRDDMCATCACRPGVVPNGCIQTQLDFLKAAHEGTPFLCHAPMDGRMCAGWVRVRAELAANPLPVELADLLQEWDYSPPDNISEN